MLCHSAFVRVATDATMSYDTAPGLCHSAFVRVATQLSTIYTRHSVFATAHSCGLRRQIISEALTYFALPQRIRAGCDDRKEVDHSGNRLCHSAFVRVATLRFVRLHIPHGLCHSAFVRVATSNTVNRRHTVALCHSAFVRVATFVGLSFFYCGFFATAHSCGLRLGQNANGVPLIILCHSAFVRVATAEKQCSALRICCEKVDSFSSVGESGLALTIFPFSFAAKATYVAINDSFGRAIDRFFWCEPHRN